MQYYVIAQDGQKYGPADVPTLNSWVKENRLWPDSVLEDAATGRQFPANMVAGIQFGAPAAGFAPPPPQIPTMPTAYPAGGYTSSRPVASDGKEWKQALGSIGLAGLALITVWFIGIGGLIFGVPSVGMGYRAITDDENWVGVVGIVLGVIAIIFWVMRRFVGLHG